ncbi:class I SAM-dependent methyltransferase [Actinoplanes sp. NPDC049265]|uniref:class I SAM-dependent methyltransferase n=1 Tax=Actinoplanes sp. NPDC049265 TaxID=3363902 RepID=UPI00371DE2C1
MTEQNLMRLLSGLAAPILAPLRDLPSGAHVVQLACGTGTLSLELARQRPDLRITGIDNNPAVLPSGTANAEFRVMDMARLDFPDGGADAVISRMGLLLPSTAPVGVASREAARVLRTDGILSLATWPDLASSPYTGIGLSVLRELLPDVPDVEAAFAGYTEELEGFRDVAATTYHWDTEYPDFESWWAFCAGFGPLAGLFARADEQKARAVMAEHIAGFRTGSGGYRLPASCRLITARR